MADSLNIVILGLSITSSWGNGHATTYRALCRALADTGHAVTFLERDRPWYATHRDLPEPPYCTVRLYGCLEELRDLYADTVRQADLIMLGSYVPDGTAVGHWLLDTVEDGITAFYDIDTPITLAGLAEDRCEYLSAELVPRFDLYLSFTGGPLLSIIRRHYRAARVEPLYCSVDPELYCPDLQEPEFDLCYLGTYSDDRQPGLEELLLKPAREWPDGFFAVAGPQYPAELRWPDNVLYVEHLPPGAHRRFYAAQRFTLNLTRREMVRAGYSPSVRLFEAAACATPIISDPWEGIDSFFQIGTEILVAHTFEDVLRYLRKLPETARRRLGERARARVLSAHTAQHRAHELERYLRRARSERTRAAVVVPFR
jgi:spore maturation protein CgeB